MALSKRLRFEILRRDNHTCRYCGRSAPEVELTVDHVIPVALGGDDEPSNLVTACRDCNSGKSSSAPDQEIVEDVARYAVALRDALIEIAEIRLIELKGMKMLWDDFDKIWCDWTVDEDKTPVPRDRNWNDSIERFLTNNLSLEELEHYVGVAMRSNVPPSQVWKYFCGICWKTIKERQETAQRVVAKEMGDG